ncbi:MAG: trehalose-phosphatase [Candidatus Thorarchaeota archaeon]
MIPLKNVESQFNQQVRATPLIALFLDYDGTLCSIKPKPELAILTEPQREVLRRLSRLPNVFLCIISGRDLSDLQQRVGIPGLALVGNHGARYRMEHQIWHERDFALADEANKGTDREYLERDKEKYKIALEEFQESLHRQSSNFDGIKIEKKINGIAVHYRNVSESEKTNVKNLIYQTMAKVDKKCLFQVQKGKMVVEILPKDSPTKGTAVRKLLWRIKQEQQLSPLSIYIGDDLTDESAFEEVNREDGWPILVAESIRKSAAKYLVFSPNEVYEWLKKLYKIRLKSKRISKW